MASNLVQLAEIEMKGSVSANTSHNDNVTHMNSTKGYTLNIDRALRNKINACRQVRVDYNITGGGFTGEIRVLAGLKFASDILSEQPQYCSDIWKFFRTFFQTLILPP